MKRDAEVLRAGGHALATSDGGAARFPSRQQALLTARLLVKDSTAGLLASVGLVANIVSFGALMFPGELSAGIPTAIWAMLIGSSIGGVMIALATSLPPIAVGIDSPTGAVLVLLSAAAGSSVLAAGGNPQTAVQTVMLIFTAATFLSGALLLGLGAFRWGSYFRFVPYFVVGGFLAATGWFLLVGGVRMSIGHALSFDNLRAVLTPTSTMKLAAAVAVLLVLLAVRRWIKSALAVPLAILVMWLTAAVVLKVLGLAGAGDGWYLRSLGTLTPWLPWEAARATHLTWSSMLQLVPEMLAVAIVALISLITKVSSIEVARQASGNLDREFRSHGIANMIITPFGGIACGMQVATSRLLEQAGAATRLSGAICALLLGAVALAHFDLPGLVPIPIVAGLVMFLGFTFVSDSLGRPYAQRAWFDLVLAVFMMVVCILYGYLIGVLVGLVSACVMFAISYARLGVMRRHATRAQFPSNVDRSAEAAKYLREAGDATRIYWLSGYVFFGSSERMFERVRGDVESAADRRVDYVILDFRLVSGADASAVASFAKLRSFCDRHGTTLVYSALSPALRTTLEQGRFFGGKSRHQAFADLDFSLAWCEDRMLADAKLDPAIDVAGFEPWLQRQLGPKVNASEFVAYLERTDAEGPQVLYRQGAPADTIDFVATGSLAIDIAKQDGQSLRVRRTNTHTVLGEMGFYRNAMRSATVSTYGPVTVFTLTRVNFEQMRRERPDLASAFDDLIVRALADRVDLANRAVVALSV